MSLYTWLRGIIHGTESTESPGNTNTSNNPCGGRETPSSEGGPRRIDLERADKLIDISTLEKVISRRASFEPRNAKEKELARGGGPRNAVACDLRPLESDQKRKAR
jgi:hypothetical protein